MRRAKAARLGQEVHMAFPEVVTRQDWLSARKRLLATEKEHTRSRDALNAERRRLPMVRIDKEYVFEGPEGNVPLAGATAPDLVPGRGADPRLAGPRSVRGALEAPARAGERAAGGRLLYVRPGPGRLRAWRDRRADP